MLFPPFLGRVFAVVADRDHDGIARRMSEPGDEVTAAVVEVIERLPSERRAKP